MNAVAIVAIVVSALAVAIPFVILACRGRPRAQERQSPVRPGEPIHDVATIITHGPGPTDEDKANKGNR